MDSMILSLFLYVDWRRSMDEETLELIVTSYINKRGDLEELFELFGLTPQEVFVTIYYAGLLDEDILENMRSL